MHYEEALSALEGAKKFGIDPSLEPIRQMCAALGNPQDAYACIQVAGTNGKSSTTRMVAALMAQDGLRVGLYTSPELVRYPERMEIGGAVVSDEAFADAIEAALGAAEACGLEATEFELLTAGALWLFAREGVELAVLECGMGGRWDATSVCTPRVAIITGIALDHTAILGDTIEAVAGEKAAIIKPGCTAVLADELAAHEVFEEQAAAVGALAIDVDPFLCDELERYLKHLPSYQARNAATALTACEAFTGRPLSTATMAEAFKKLQIPGRFETLRREPLLLIDAAHNPQSAQVLAEEVRLRWPAPKDRPTLLLGVLADKDVPGVVAALAPLFGRIVCTRSTSPRAIGADELAAIVRDAAPAAAVTVIGSIPEALEALAGEDVIATGSITVAGEVKGTLLGIA